MHITNALRVARVPALVSSGWLAGHLAAKPPHLRLLDATWDAAGQVGHGDYCRNHIAGASFLDLNQIMKVTSPTILRSVPSQRQFGDYVASLGINNDSHVVLYDTHQSFCMPYGAARTWWLFRLFGHEQVSVLDGGIRKWMKEGRPTTTDTPTVQKGDFTAEMNEALLFTYDQMVDNVEQKKRQVLDTRLPADFQGLQDEPASLIKKFLEVAGIDPESVKMHKGHMRHAVNIPFENIENKETFGLLPKDQLLKLFEEKGVNVNSPLVATCYVGMTACTLALAAAVCGNTDVPVYSGSWTEFGQRAKDHLVETE